MPAYVVALDLKRKLNQKNYASLLRVIAGFPRGLKLSETVLLVPHPGPANVLVASLAEHLHQNDEILVLRVVEASGSLNNVSADVLRLIL